MSINPITGAASTIASDFLITSTPKTTSTSTSGSTATGSGPDRFKAAIDNAFASLGISVDGSSTSTAASTASSTSANSDPSSTDNDASNAVAAFMQSLFAALHGQSTPPPAADGTSPVDGTAPAATTTAAAATADPTAATTGAVHHGHHGHGGHGGGDLQSLISALTASDSTDPSAATSSTTTTGTSSALSNLETQFGALLQQNGLSTTNSADTLKSFLTNLASNLEGASPAGNVVQTTA